MPEENATSSSSSSMDEKPCSSTAATVEGLDDVFEEAKKLIGSGNRHMVMGDVVSAVSVFQEACGMLAEKYGDTADECGEAFFLCGKALLELARMENTVLGNALDGVPEESSEEGEKQNDSKIESADNLDEQTRDELREQVYDAMAEKESKDGGKMAREETSEESKEGTEAEKPTEDSKLQGSIQTEKQVEETIEIQESKTPLEKHEDDPQVEKKPEENTEEKGLEHSKQSSTEKETVDQVEKLEPSDPHQMTKEVVETNSSEEAKEVVETHSSEEPVKESSKSGIEASSIPSPHDKASKALSCEEKAETSTPQQEPAESKLEDGEVVESKEAADEEMEEGDDEDDDDDDDNEDGEGNAEDKESEDEVGNLQLAWEMLEVAKVIYKKKEGKEEQLMMSQILLKLGEVGVESGNYAQAIDDFQDCLCLQLKHLPPHSRLLAETHYQLGVTFSFTNEYRQAIDHFNSSIKVIETRVAMLQEVIDKAEEEEAVKETKTELDELKQLLPEIKEKIEDAKESQKTAAVASVAIQQTMGGASTSSAFPCENGGASSSAVKQIPVKPTEGAATSKSPASDISHLVRKKRKPEEESPKQDSEAKKVKQESTLNGSGDSASNGNGVQEKMEQEASA